MGKSPYPAVRVPVDYSRPLPGAPRERLTTLRQGSTGKARHLADGHTLTGVNAASGNVWGARVAPVTGRKSRKSPGWSSKVAGGHRIDAAGV